MKYYTWKLNWADGEGTDPAFTVNNDEVRIEPVFATGEFSNPNTLIYSYLIKGNIDTTLLTQWQVSETTVEEMLMAAQVLVPGATLVNEIIQFPNHLMEIS